MRKRVALKNYSGEGLTVVLVEAERCGSSSKAFKSLGNKWLGAAGRCRSALESTGAAPATSSVRAQSLGQSRVCTAEEDKMFPLGGCVWGNKGLLGCESASVRAVASVECRGRPEILACAFSFSFLQQAGNSKQGSAKVGAWF